MDEGGVRWLSSGMADVPMGDDWLTAGEAAWAAGMRYAKRLSEYRLARWCAKSAISAIVDAPLQPSDIEIRHLPEGAPAAFVHDQEFALRISMTDRADWAVCAIGPPGVEVGCDLELIESRSTAFVRDYFVPSEQQTVLVDGIADPMLSNVIWSAKESALKVLRTGLRRSTRSVVVSLGEEDGQGWLPLVVQSSTGHSFEGWWRRFGEFVLTIAGDAATAPPEALDDPIALFSATPGHGWMASS